MIRKILIFILIFGIVFSLISCSTNQGLVDDLKKEINKKENRISELEIELERKNEIEKSTQNPNQLVSEAFKVMEMIANKDAAALNTKVSPTRGLRFSPYQYVDEDKDIVFYPNKEITSMFTNTRIYLWGEYDGTGDDMSRDFTSYYNEFVYNEDYLNPKILGINTVVSHGNTLNNIEDVYINDEYVEFYFDGFDPQYEGMDWKSLTLVFEKVNDTYYLVGVISGRWTI